MLNYAHLIENYPGFPKGISGEKLARQFLSHCRHLEIFEPEEEVLNVRYENGRFSLLTSIRELLVGIVVIATGTIPRIPGFIDPGHLRSGRVHTGISGLTSETGLEIGIIGGGDAAFDCALNLAERGNRVDILMRSDIPRAMPLLVGRARLSHLVTVHSGLTPLRLDVEQGSARITFKTEPGTITKTYTHLVLATGRDPALGFLSDNVRMQMQQLIDEKKLYLAGDVKNGSCRQVAVACGDGMKAAMEIHRYAGDQ
jgi:thioredoxin reductase (NADPH)